MINSSVIVGRLTANPELKTTNSGKSVTSFIIASQRDYKNGQGEYDCDFISCTIWGKSAEVFCKYVAKGNIVSVQGRIQTGSYMNKNNEKVYTTQVVVSTYGLLPQGNPNKEQQNNQNSNFNNNTNDSQNNYDGYGYNTADPFTSKPDTVNVSDDDLPF